MAEGADANFSGGKRGLEVEDDRPAPKIGGRKAWIYSTEQGRERGGRGSGPGRGGAAGRGPATGKDSGSGCYYAGGYSGKKR
jgi:hypothetical protein